MANYKAAPGPGTPQVYGQYSSYNAGNKAPVKTPARRISPLTSEPAQTQPDADALALARAARIELEGEAPARNKTGSAVPDALYQSHPNTAPVADVAPQPDTNEAAAGPSALAGYSQAEHPHRPLASQTPLDEPTLPTPLADL